MSEFLEYILWMLQNSLLLVLLVGIAASAVLGITYFIHKRKYKGKKKYPWGKVFLCLVFIGYLAVVLYATTFRASFGHRAYNLHLFRAWREAWNNFSVKNWANVLLNIALFGPLGFLLPLMGWKFRKWYVTIPTGFAFSLAIELFQLIMGRGVCDVDDLFCNSLGAAIGYFIIMTILSLRNKKGKRVKPVLAYGSLSLICVMAVCSVFAAYHMQEYGKLPNAAAFTTDTSGMAWNLECDLPTVEDEVPVYRTQTRSIEECDAFGEFFRKIVGAEYTTISYYQEAAYYMDQAGDENGTHFLFVSYMDPSYEYSFGLGDDPVWCDADRETIEAALSDLPVSIPEYADFTADGNGWHTFRVDQHVDGAGMVDGVLRCRYAEDGTIRELENKLLSYSYHDRVNVISPEEAYEQLRDGKFGSGGFFESLNPDKVSVISCRLGYEIDTKGFYQPVYYFEIMIPETGTLLVFIPAMK